MKKYHKYTIQERNYSPNVIIGHYDKTNEIILTATISKKEGDELIENICNLLNKQINESNI
jgi:hypothetical protein